MKRLGLAAIALAVAVTAADAAAPKASGKYSVLGSAFCSFRLKSTADTYRLANGNSAAAVKTLETAEDGVMSALTGYLTIKPASANASNGKATLDMTQIRGPAGTLNAASNWRTKTVHQTGTYSLSDHSLTFNSDTYVMTFANVQNGIARTINLIHRETGANTACVDALTATRQ